MAKPRERAIEQLDSGSISFLVQPRVHTEGIAHVLMRLQSDSGPERIVVIGRKRIADRFWALVTDKIAGRTEEMAAGDYEIYEHGAHTHLAFTLRERVDEFLRRSTGLPRSGSFIVTVMNPDPAAWGGDPQEELFREYVRVPTPFPDELQARFHGRKYAKLDRVEFLDCAGAELVLISR